VSEVAELLAEHARLLEEKARYRERLQAPPTTINQRLTQIVDRIEEEATSARGGGAEREQKLRDLLQREADSGSLAGAEAIDRLAGEDPWWGERTSPPSG
jgi:hypothetical protein